MTLHKSIPLGSHHVPYNWAYDNTAARIAASGFGSSDVGKFARQLDDDSIWMLVNHSPITWVPITGAFMGQLDGYASDTTIQEHYSQLSSAIQTILKDLDGYASTADEHYTQHSEAIDLLRQAADGYDSSISGLDNTVQEHKEYTAGAIKAITDVLDGYDDTSAISGLDNTVQEHKEYFASVVKSIVDVLDGYSDISAISGLDNTVQEHKEFVDDTVKTIIDALDGYNSSIIGLDNTVQEHKEYTAGAIKAITDVLDGYDDTSAISGLDNTVQEHKEYTAGAVKAIVDVLDGYATSGGVSETTFQEFKNAQYDVNDTIIQALDGYITAAGDGVSETTFQEFKNSQYDVNDSIIQALDGYAGGGGVSETTFQEFKNAQYDVNDTIIASLDGYSNDGYNEVIRTWDLLTTTGAWEYNTDVVPNFGARGYYVGAKFNGTYGSGTYQTVYVGNIIVAEDYREGGGAQLVIYASAKNAGGNAYMKAEVSASKVNDDLTSSSNVIVDTGYLTIPCHASAEHMFKLFEIDLGQHSLTKGHLIGLKLTRQADNGADTNDSHLWVLIGRMFYAAEIEK